MAFSRTARCLAAVGLLTAAVAGVQTSALAQPPKADTDGLYVNVPNPIDSDAFKNIKNRVLSAIKARAGIQWVIFDFTPRGEAAATSHDDLGNCASLARFIRGLDNGAYPEVQPRTINTVAYVRSEVSKHTVLPVLACSQLVMANQSEGKNPQVGSIGDVLKGQGDLDQSEKQMYRDLPRMNFPRALVFRMIYPDRDIHRVKLPNGSEDFLDDDGLRAHKDKDKLVKLPLPDGLAPGQARMFADTLHKLRLCQIQDTPAKVVKFYQLSRNVLTEVWLGDQPIVPGLIEVKGVLDAGKRDSLKKRIDRARGKGINFLIFYLDSEGGDTTAANDLAHEILKLNDPLQSPMRTLAYIPSRRSTGATTFLALACNEIVMADDAVLGDFSYLPKTDSDEVHKAGRRRQLAELAQNQGYAPALFEAMLDRNLALYELQTGDTFQIVTEEELQKLQKDREDKKLPKLPATRIPRKEGEYFKLNAEKARQFSVVAHNSVKTLDELYKLYAIPESRVTVFRDDWLDEVAEFFRRPIVKVLLIMIGIIGMILELKLPGTAFPGIIAALCFVLFFWAHSFVGQYTMLAVLLFVLGLILIGLEVFVFPGFGIPGIAGILMVVGSLVLVTLERMPSTPQDWVSLGITLTTFGVSLILAIAGAFMLAWYLPHIPYANRMVLAPPTDGSSGGFASAESNPLASLLGAIGVAETPLRPAGKARLGDDYHDVIAEGDFVNPGARVQVIEIDGNRIVVKEI